MHPAPSIILFTVLSGLGFGMMIWLGLGTVDVKGWIAAAFCAIAIGLSGGGLLSSLFHLGHPERFLKALTQWRSSWLSREGILALATIATFSLFSVLWVFFSIRSAALGGLAALLGVATVFCTAMIYAQMKTIPRWNSPLTPAIFLLASLSGGALLTNSAATPWLLALLGLALIVDELRGRLAFQKSGATLSTATGIAASGRPRLLAPPHTGSNYLMREMVFDLGRKRIQPLLYGGFFLAVLLPVCLLLSVNLGHTVALVAVMSHITGIIMLRWLFFARAEHVVGLYYGKHR